MGMLDVFGGMSKKKLVGTTLSVIGAGITLFSGLEEEQETRKRQDNICRDYAYKAGKDCWMERNAGQKSKKKTKAERKQK